MKTDEDLIAYISLWCGARNALSPYQYCLCFRSQPEHAYVWFYFESAKDRDKAANYLRDNCCSVYCYDSRPTEE